MVTGASGLLGRLFVRHLAKAGARVAALDLQRSDSNNKKIWPVSADVTSSSSLRKALASVVERWGVPDVLINNAGVDTPPTHPTAGRVSFEEFPVAEWDRVLDVNLKGIFLTCQVIGGAMARKKRGSIINIGSIYGMHAPDQRIYDYLRKPNQPPFVKPVAYSASKSGVMNLTRYLAGYWGLQGVRVNTLVPGGIFNQHDRRFLKAFTAKVPQGRMANPEELIGPLLFLASEASSYMTGAALVVDGGYSVW